MTLLLFSRHSGESVTYYAGSGWSKADMPTFAAWTDYLKTQLHLSEARLTVDWRK